MASASVAAGAGRIGIDTAFRSYATQDALYDKWLARRGRTWTDTWYLRPGYSEHQTGLTVDLLPIGESNCTINDCIDETPQGAWLARNAWRYGYILRYEKGYRSTVGLGFEPWHFRYVGTELARRTTTAAGTPTRRSSDEPGADATEPDRPLARAPGGAASAYHRGHDRSADAASRTLAALAAGVAALAHRSGSRRRPRPPRPPPPRPRPPLARGRRPCPVAAIAGADRYATSVARLPARLPQRHHGPGGLPRARGTRSEAYGAVPAAAALGGGVLLTRPDGIPSVVAAELDRLNPARIVLVGDTEHARDGRRPARAARYAPPCSGSARRARVGTSQALNRFAFRSATSGLGRRRAAAPTESVVGARRRRRAPRPGHRARRHGWPTCPRPTPRCCATSGSRR